MAAVTDYLKLCKSQRIEREQLENIFTIWSSFTKINEHCWSETGFPLHCAITGDLGVCVQSKWFLSCWFRMKKLHNVALSSHPRNESFHTVSFWSRHTLTHSCLIARMSFMSGHTSFSFQKHYTTLVFWVCEVLKWVFKVWVHQPDVALVSRAPPADCLDLVAGGSPLPHLLHIKPWQSVQERATILSATLSQWGMAGECLKNSTETHSLMTRGWKQSCIKQVTFLVEYVHYFFY